MAEYYDMQEVQDKLRKSEEEVQNLVKEGQLRQYMDSGKAVFKVVDVDRLAEEIVGLDISGIGLSPDDSLPDANIGSGGGSDLDIMLEETAGLELEPDDTEKPSDGGSDDMELDLEPDLPKQKESEGGFGLSQMGDLTMADTNVGTVGINILSGTGDAYQLTEDTKAETQAGDIDDLDSLDADSNLESFGSGSGLLDLSLQADDTSLGAVLDDILPTGAEGGADLPVDDGMGLMDEPEDLLGSGSASAAKGSAGMAAPMGVAETAPAAAGPGVQMVAVAPVDPKSGIFGVMMMLPLLALVLAAIVLTAAIQDVVPSLIKPLIEGEVAGISMIWVIVGGLTVLLLLILMFSAVSGGGGGTKTKKPKAKKEKKPKKEKPAKKKRK